MILKIFKKKNYTENQVNKGVKFLKSCSVILNKHFPVKGYLFSPIDWRLYHAEQNPVQQFNCYCYGIYQYELEKIISKKSGNFERFTIEVFKKLLKGRTVVNYGFLDAIEYLKLFKDAKYYLCREFHQGYKDAKNYKGNTINLIEKMCLNHKKFVKK